MQIQPDKKNNENAMFEVTYTYTVAAYCYLKYRNKYYPYN
eukprot:SAG11_NODE_3756_length_2249_cov_3.183256_1_plen_40_part_00